MCKAAKASSDPVCKGGSKGCIGAMFKANREKGFRLYLGSKLGICTLYRYAYIQKRIMIRIGSRFVYEALISPGSEKNECFLHLEGGVVAKSLGLRAWDMRPRAFEHGHRSSPSFSEGSVWMNEKTSQT